MLATRFVGGASVCWDADVRWLGTMIGATISPMRLFDVKEYGNTAMLAHPQRIESTVGGYRAPGPGVLVIEEGNVWVTLQDGGRQNVSAVAVVMYEANDWVEYGSYGPQPFRTRNYWADAEPVADSERRLAEIFGGSTPEDPA